MLPILYEAAFCILLLILLILFISFNVIIDISKKKDLIDKRVTVNWMGLSYTIKKKGKRTKKRKDKNETEDKVKKSGEKSSIRNVSEMIGIIRTVKKPFLKLLEELFKVFKIQKISSDITFGFQDPYDTGIVCGFLYSTNALLYQKCKNCNYSINPQFMDTVFDFYFIAEVRLRLCSLFLPVLSFVSNRKVLSLAWTIIRRQHIPKPSINI
ncbi:MAG: DUF2953 domain-containing protein [Methanosarcinaceae archaeon]|nr:DUF2953 domain-containing protein [Methanosarcinaceae archaeon]